MNMLSKVTVSWKKAFLGRFFLIQSLICWAEGAVPKGHCTDPLLVSAGSVTLLMFVLVDKYSGL